jgi:hypothetical protein
MSSARFQNRSTNPDTRYHHVRLLGAGAAAPTKSVGRGVTVSRTGAGVYRITWAENPGVFLGMSWSLGSTTPGDVKTFTVTRGNFTPASATVKASVDLSVWNAAGTATDLASGAAQLDLLFVFASQV